MSEFRLHGANPDKLYKSFGIEMPRRVIDFSTNTNALPWTGSLDLDLPELLANYPDDESSALRELLAVRNGCLPDEILITNGSNEAVYLLAAHFAEARRNFLLQPVYGEYARALGAAGARVKDIFSFAELEDGQGLLWLCNPCNPTGAWISAETMAEALESCPGVRFIVDEAYIDFLTVDGKRLNPACYGGRLIIMRSLTKLFHLCGARVGYVIADGGTIRQLKGRQPTWSVNAVAQAAALAFLQDESYPVRTSEFYRAETPRFMGLIRNAGFNALPTSVNFFLVETDCDRKLIDFLLRRGLVVRHTRNFAGLDGRYVRIATRLPRENDELAAALAAFLS